VPVNPTATLSRSRRTNFRTGGGRNVTFPARQYAVNGERRGFALLRPITDIKSQERIRDVVLQAYAEYEQSPADAE